MNYKHIPIALLLFFGLIVFIYYLLTNKTGVSNTPYTKAEETNALPIITINNVQIPVEVANTPQKREQGLSGREKNSFPDGQGMLFKFDSEGMPVFWMIDTKFPLDMIWIANNKVVDISKNVPTPAVGMPASQLPKYSPKYPVNYVLEVNAGFTDNKGISVGDSVDLNAIQ